jgi:dihydrofolate reductase
MTRKFSIIVACDMYGGIGCDNKIPWELPEELQYFKKITTETLDHTKQNAVIMGRNTWLSLPKKPLQKRKNIILSRNTLFKTDTENTQVCNSINEALLLCQEDVIESIFIIGGSQIYSKCINEYSDLIENIYLTIVNDKRYECDSFIDIDYILEKYRANENGLYINQRYINIILN